MANFITVSYFEMDRGLMLNLDEVAYFEEAYDPSGNGEESPDEEYSIAHMKNGEEIKLDETLTQLNYLIRP